MAKPLAPDAFVLGLNGRTQTLVHVAPNGTSWVLIDAGWARDTARILPAASALSGTDARPTELEPRVTAHRASIPFTAGGVAGP